MTWRVLFLAAILFWNAMLIWVQTQNPSPVSVFVGVFSGVAIASALVAALALDYEKATR